MMMKGQKVFTQSCDSPVFVRVYEAEGEWAAQADGGTGPDLSVFRTPSCLLLLISSAECL